MCDESFRNTVQSHYIFILKSLEGIFKGQVLKQKTWKCFPRKVDILTLIMEITNKCFIWKENQGFAFVFHLCACLSMLISQTYSYIHTVIIPILCQGYGHLKRPIVSFSIMNFEWCTKTLHRKQYVQVYISTWPDKHSIQNTLCTGAYS